jgi:hypothetical protein
MLLCQSLAEYKRLKQVIFFYDCWITPRSWENTFASNSMPFAKYYRLFSKTDESINRQAAAVIMKIAYGYATEPHKRDPLANLASEAMDQFAKAGVPGAWLVDIVPARMATRIDLVLGVYRLITN